MTPKMRAIPELRHEGKTPRPSENLADALRSAEATLATVRC